MNRNVEYIISIVDIIRMLKYRWKLLCLILLVCVALCGGYKALSNTGDSQALQADSEYEEDMEFYNSISESEQVFPDLLKSEWKSICYDRVNNPIYSINPYNCEYEQLVIRFEDGKNHDWTVNNWIFKADDEELFGDKQDTLSDFKSSLILIGQKEDQTETSETAVQLLVVDEYDAQKAADYLVKQLKQFATEENIGIEEISRASAEGYSEYVDAYQQRNRDRYNSIYNTINNSKYMGPNNAAPVSPADEQRNKLKDIIKYCLMGLILGLIVGVIIIFFNVIRKHKVISARQIENAFNLELLSDCSSDKATSLDVLNANLDVMTSEHSKIAIVADDTLKDLIDIASKLTEKSDRTFVACIDIFDNPDMIEALKTTDGVVIAVKIGTSKLDQIQRIILRTDKLNLKVLGYVLL